VEVGLASRQPTRQNGDMPKRSSKKPTEAIAADQPQEATPEVAAMPAPELAQPAADGKNPAAVALGRLGGKKGGPARAKKLTREQRSEIARKAAQERWRKRNDQEAAR
jgi:hypothetical protein